MVFTPNTAKRKHCYYYFARCAMSIMLLVVLAMLLIPSLSNATNDTNSPDIRTQFVLQLPGYWNLETLNISESVDYGTNEEPIIKQRFTADLMLKEDTYSLAKEEANVTWLDLVAETGLKRTVHGIATSTQTSGAWNIQLALESDPTASLGQPLSFFPGKVIIKGSPQEQQYWGEIKAEQQRSYKQNAQRRLAMDLPGYLKVKEFSLVDTDTQLSHGSSGNLVDSQKFVAVVELSTDTFKAIGDIGEATLLSLIAPKGEQRKMYGRIKPSKEKDNKNFVIEYENNVAEGLGDPADFFKGRVFIEGTPEVEVYLKKLHDKELKDIERKKALVEANNKVEVARLNSESKINALKREYKARESAAESKAKEEERKRLEMESKEKQMWLAQEQAAAAKREVLERQKQDEKQKVEELRLAQVKEAEAIKKAEEKNRQVKELQKLKDDLFGSDQIARSLALTSVLDKNKVLGGVIFRVQNNKSYDELPFHITIEQFDLATNRFTGILSVSDLSGKVSGGLQGLTINASAPLLNHPQNKNTHKYLSISVDLAKGGHLIGTADNNLGRGRNKAIIKLF